MSIEIFGSKTLRKGCRQVGPDFAITDYSNMLIDNARHNKLIGLSLPQVGKRRRMFTILIDGKYEVFINPKIEFLGDETDVLCQCASLPGIKDTIKRNNKIKVKYLDNQLNQKEEEFEGELAFEIQHQYDHLDGALFIDYLSDERYTEKWSLKLNNIRKNIKEKPSRSRRGYSADLGFNNSRGTLFTTERGYNTRRGSGVDVANETNETTIRTDQQDGYGDELDDLIGNAGHPENDRSENSSASEPDSNTEVAGGDVENSNYEDIINEMRNTTSPESFYRLYQEVVNQHNQYYTSSSVERLYREFTTSLSDLDPPTSEEMESPNNEGEDSNDSSDEGTGTIME